MSKLFDKYEMLKNNNPEIIYLFECGNFFVILDSDAIICNELFNLKLTKFSKECDKCGFPKESLIKYERLLKENNITYRIIYNDNKSKEEKLQFIGDIIDCNIDELSVIELKEIINKIRNVIFN